VKERPRDPFFGFLSLCHVDLKILCVIFRIPRDILFTLPVSPRVDVFPIMCLYLPLLLDALLQIQSDVCVSNKESHGLRLARGDWELI
jgi:hypothetical protein